MQIPSCKAFSQYKQYTHVKNEKLHDNPQLSKFDKKDSVTFCGAHQGHIIEKNK